MMPQRRTLEDLRFDNTYAKLPEAFYAKLNPTPFSTPPHLISFNPAAAALIDLDPEEATRPEFAGVFGGSLLVPGMEPLAMLYAGHQFGVYVPQLGDGRAILLGEAVSDSGVRWDFSTSSQTRLLSSLVNQRPASLSEGSLVMKWFLFARGGSGVAITFPSQACSWKEIRSPGSDGLERKCLE